MRRFFSAVIFAVCVFCGCSSKDSIILSGKVRNIVPKPMEAINPIKKIVHSELTNSIIGCVAIHQVSETEILLHKLSGDHCFTWVDLGTGNTKDVISRGRGPGELLDAGFCGSRLNELGEVEFAAYDINLGKCVIYNLAETLAGNENKVVSEMPIPDNTMTCLWLGESTFNYVFGDGVSFKECDSAGTIVKEYHPFREGCFWGSNSHLFCANSVSPQNDRIVMAMSSMPRLFVYDVNEKESISISLDSQSDKSLISKLKQSDSEDSSYFLWSVANNAHICVSCVNQESIASGMMEEDVYVLNWNGDLQKILHIPDFLVNFIINDDATRLYGITMDSEIIEYSF